MILGHILCYEDYQNATICIGVEEVDVMEVMEVMEVDMMGVICDVGGSGGAGVNSCETERERGAQDLSVSCRVGQSQDVAAPRRRRSAPEK